MSHDKDNPIKNETGEYLQELTEKTLVEDKKPVEEVKPKAVRRNNR